MYIHIMQCTDSCYLASRQYMTVLSKPLISLWQAGTTHTCVYTEFWLVDIVLFPVVCTVTYIIYIYHSFFFHVCCDAIRDTANDEHRQWRRYGTRDHVSSLFYLAPFHPTPEIKSRRPRYTYGHGSNLLRVGSVIQCGLSKNSWKLAPYSCQLIMLSWRLDDLDPEILNNDKCQHAVRRLLNYLLNLYYISGAAALTTIGMRNKDFVID